MKAGSGRSASDDPARDATAIWVALHGTDTLLDRIVIPVRHPRQDRQLSTLAAAEVLG
jgi:hypothetical protein